MQTASKDNEHISIVTVFKVYIYMFYSIQQAVLKHIVSNSQIRLQPSCHIHVESCEGHPPSTTPSPQQAAHRMVDHSTGPQNMLNQTVRSTT